MKWTQGSQKIFCAEFRPEDFLMTFYIKLNHKIVSFVINHHERNKVIEMFKGGVLEKRALWFVCWFFFSFSENMVLGIRNGYEKRREQTGKRMKTKEVNLAI